MTFGILSPHEINLLLAIFMVEVATGFWMWRRLVTARIKDENSLSPQQRSWLYFYILALVLILVIAVTLGGILSHFDREWYIKMGAPEPSWTLSPAHYYIFLICYPVYVTVGLCMHILVKNHLPSLIDTLKRPIIIATAVPLIFIPAIDGNLLGANVTVPEMLYVGFYWIASAIWLGLGIAPITYNTMKRFVGELSQ